MEVDGDYIYWGEDRVSATGISLYRAHRQTMAVDEVGQGDIVGSPWRFLETSDDRLLFMSNSIHYQGQVVPGSDDFVRLYELNADRTDYYELARFPVKKNAFSGADPLGFTEAFGRLWINGYNITELQKDLVGRLVLVGLGDFDSDDQLTVADIDALSLAIRQHSELPIYDLDLSGTVDQVDRRIWVKDVKHTYFGDADLDGQFGSADMLAAFVAGQYEDGVSGNSTWSSGDWTGDGEFGTDDLLLAFQEGGYEQGPRSAATPVPEPFSLTLGLLGLTSLQWFFRRT